MEQLRSHLLQVARTSLRTKLNEKLADHITECVVDAVLAIRKNNESAPDLHMIEIQVGPLYIMMRSGTSTTVFRVEMVFI